MTTITKQEAIDALAQGRLIEVYIGPIYIDTIKKSASSMVVNLFGQCCSKYIGDRFKYKLAAITATEHDQNTYLNSIHFDDWDLDWDRLT